MKVHHLDCPHSFYTKFVKAQLWILCVLLIQTRFRAWCYNEQETRWQSLWSHLWRPENCHSNMNNFCVTDWAFFLLETSTNIWWVHEYMSLYYKENSCSSILDLNSGINWKVSNIIILQLFWSFTSILLETIKLKNKD